MSKLEGRIDGEDFGASTIFIAYFCKYTGVKAEVRGDNWICPEHDTAECVNTFRNMSFLDEVAGGRPEPGRPSKEEIEKHRQMLERTRVYHEITFWIQSPVKSLKRWEDLHSQLDDVFAKFKLKHTSTGGPIPETKGRG